MENLIAPLSYQGGKPRLSKQILEEINKRVDLKDKILIDLCCGSGAVGLESLNYCKKVIFVDKGEMGVFYSSLQDFSLQDFKKEIEKLPALDGIKDYLTARSKEEVPKDKMQRLYLYLLLQAGAFGGKQIWVEGEEWKNCSFRSYWKPTLTSNRRSPVNPMMPLPDTLYKRVENILRVKDIVKGFNCDIKEFLKGQNLKDCVIYIDPPYENTTGYLDSFDIREVIDQLKGYTVFVSYNEVLSEDYIDFGKRKKGNFNGKKQKESVKEILNCFLERK